MKIELDEDVLKRYDLTLGESIILYLALKKINIKDCIESIIAKGLVLKDLIEDGKLIVPIESAELLSSVVIDSNNKVINRDEEFRELAKKIQELYPKGRKSGTTYMWRGTVAEIAKKLKTLVVKYNFEFTEEQALSATKKYVESFNGDYTKMRLLKYFILKNIKDADNNVELVSDFMSLIENEGQEDANNDWTIKLV